MARQQKVYERTKWHQSTSGCWSLSLGTRGCRVRVMQREPGGTFIRVTWDPGIGKQQASLGTTSRTEARARAEAFFDALATMDRQLPVNAPLTLYDLWRRYESHAAFNSNRKVTQTDKRSRIKSLLRGLGEQTVVTHLTKNTLLTYCSMRRNGNGWPDGGTSLPVGARSIQADVVFLQTMLNWATNDRNPDGSWLLSENPLRGFKTTPEKNPRRPVAVLERFEATRKAMRALGATATTDTARLAWPRIELALVIAEDTGKRRGAIAALRWDAIDLECGKIRWDGRYAKNGVSETLPLSRTLLTALQEHASCFATSSEWLFPNASGTGPWPGKMFDELLIKAEHEAGLEKLQGSLWHAYRRKWRTEREPHDRKAVQVVGGWKDAKTMEDCYNIPFDESMRTVINSPYKLSAKGVVRIER